VYLLAVIKPPLEVLDDIDKLRIRFLWAGDKALTGGKCKVNWTKTSLPKEFGGLSILNLGRFASTLRLRWVWHEWTSPDKAWVGTEVPCTEQDRLLFAACTTITLGDGHKTSFWSSGWLQGHRPKDIAPPLYAKSKKKKRIVAEALLDNAWLRDLDYRTGFTTTHLSQLVMLWNLVKDIALRQDQEDHITWTQTPHGEYTSASAYMVRFNGCVAAPGVAIIWKTWAPPKCKFFAWLILQNRVWTSDRLARREWDHCPSCPLCRETMESAHHLLASCRFTCRVWTLVAGWTSLVELRPAEWPASRSPLHWWKNLSNLPDVPRKGVRSFILLVIWEVWKERNDRVFNRREAAPPSTAAKIKSEASVWIVVGAKDLTILLART
jgi:hypothetical protein